MYYWISVHEDDEWKPSIIKDVLELAQAVVATTQIETIEYDDEENHSKPARHTMDMVQLEVKDRSEHDAFIQSVRDLTRNLNGRVDIMSGIQPDNSREMDELYVIYGGVFSRDWDLTCEHCDKSVIFEMEKYVGSDHYLDLYDELQVAV